MADKLGSNTGWRVLLGSGARLAGLGPLLRALGPDGGSTGQVASLGDVADLLSGFGGEGRLILDADEMPPEDIGIVRRFLMDHTRWALLVLGIDAGRHSARALLALPRSGWMPWPPDLDQLRALALPVTAPAPVAGSAPGLLDDALASSSAASDLARIGERLERAFESLCDAARLSESQSAEVAAELHRLRRFTRAAALLASPPARGSEHFDLDSLLEEELAVLALRQRKAPRFQYRGGAAQHVRADRGALTGAFEALLRLARSCAAEGETVRVHTSQHEGRVEVELEFPAGPLKGIDPRTVFEPGALGELADFGSHELAAARVVARSQGGELDLADASTDPVRLRMSLPSAGQESATGGGRARAARAAAPGPP